MADREPTVAARRTWWGGIALACVAVLALRVAEFGSALGNDEAGSAVVGHSWLVGEHAAGAARLYGAYWLDRPPLLPLLYGLADLAGGAAGVRVLGALAAVALTVLVAHVARRMADARTGLVAAGFAAAIASASTLGGDRTYGELLAAVPATGSIALLLVAVQGGVRRRRWVLLASGACAVAAPLVKQSALDAGLVGLVTLGWLAWRGRDRGRAAIGDLLTWSAGVAAVLLATLAWAATLADGGVRALYDAVVGFRVDALQELQRPGEPLLAGVDQLVLPLVASGLVLLAIAAPAGVARSRPGIGRVVLVTWIVGAVLGVLGGGYYWPHYLLQLAAPLAIAAAVALRGLPRPALAAAVATLLAFGAVGPLLRSSMPHSGTFDGDARRVGEYVAAQARDGDRLRVLHARPGVAHAAGLQLTSPYLWSAMQETRPGIRAQLLDDLRDARSGATWVVAWNGTDTYDLDPDGAVAAALRTNFREVATVCGRRVLLRRGVDRDVTAAASDVGCVGTDD